jgi:NAD(P)-dependent dehydrogenase (short-subunit alcohol dehydrogenase family)
MIDLRNRLAVVSESGQQAAETEQSIRQLGVKPLAVSADATRNEDVEAFVASIQRALAFSRPVDILVNNVGGMIARKTIDEMDESFWDRVASSDASYINGAAIDINGVLVFS